MNVTGVKRGIDALREATKPTERNFSEFNWFKLSPKDGENTVMVRFLQELDEGADGYREDAGTAPVVVILEPPTPDGWKHRYVVSEDNEELLSQLSDWKFRTRLFINVAVERDGEWQLELWDASQSVARQLIEFHSEEGGITNQNFKVRRVGKGTETQYMFFPKGASDFDFDQFDTVDPEKVAFKELTQAVIDEFSGPSGGTSEEDEWV